MNRTIRSSLLTLAALLWAACSAPSAEEGPGDLAPESSAQDSQLPPPGYGTLRQDDISVAFVADDVQVKVTPLDESVIRLAAPDTYQRLHGMVASRDVRIQDQAQKANLRQNPRVFLVSFFTRAQQKAFAPTELQLLSQGILYRPLGIIPLTPTWGREQLKQEEFQAALYLFHPAIDLDVAFQLEYGGARSVDWSRIIRVLQAERGRVLSRAKA